MKKKYKITLVLVSIASAAICVLPVMSIYLSDGESSTLFVRGYNLMEFSALGCIPLFAPLFIPAILFGSQTKAVKETELLILFAGNVVCYVHGFNAARLWLDSLGGSFLTFYPGMLLIPFAFSMLLILSKVFEQLTHRSYMVLEYDADTLSLKEDKTNE